jgi:hypothetical protein
MDPPGFIFAGMILSQKYAPSRNGLQIYATIALTDWDFETKDMGGFDGLVEITKLMS